MFMSITNPRHDGLVQKQGPSHAVERQPRRRQMKRRLCIAFSMRISNFNYFEISQDTVRSFQVSRASSMVVGGEAPTRSETGNYFLSLSRYPTPKKTTAFTTFTVQSNNWGAFVSDPPTFVILHPSTFPTSHNTTEHLIFTTSHGKTTSPTNNHREDLLKIFKPASNSEFLVFDHLFISLLTIFRPSRFHQLQSLGDRVESISYAHQVVSVGQNKEISLKHRSPRPQLDNSRSVCFLWV